jgi:hypothetical protein
MLWSADEVTTLPNGRAWCIRGGCCMQDSLGLLFRRQVTRGDLWMSVDQIEAFSFELKSTDKRRIFSALVSKQ